VISAPKALTTSATIRNKATETRGWTSEWDLVSKTRFDANIGDPKNPGPPGLSSRISDVYGIASNCWMQHHFFSILIFANHKQTGQSVRTDRLLEQRYQDDAKID
jgi:hypothetical protein